MASSYKRQNSSIKQELQLHPREFDLNQALWILRKIYDPYSKQSKRFQTNLIIKTHVHHGQTPTPIVELNLQEKKAIIKLGVFGVAVSKGPLPTPFIDFIFDRIRQKETTIIDFLDIFHARLVHHWYESFTSHYEHLSEHSVSKTGLSKSLIKLAGCVEKNEEQSDEIELYKRYSGLFWHNPKTELGLQRLLSTFFEFNITVYPFEGQWLTADEDEQSRLGSNKRGFQKLGKTCVLGKRQWHQSKGVILFISDLTWHDYLNYYVADSQNLKKKILKIAKLYLGPYVTVTLKITLAPKNSRPMSLGSGLLGQTSFVQAC